MNEALIKMNMPGLKQSSKSRTYFDTNNLEVYAFAPGIEMKTFDAIIKSEEIVFNNGHLYIQGENLRISDHPDTGLPFKNFEI
jgi:hypothetical protein